MNRLCSLGRNIFLKPAASRSCALQPSLSTLMNTPLAAAAAPYTHQVRQYGGLPTNLIVMFVPTQEAWVVERMGKFNHVMEPVSFKRYSNLLDKLLLISSVF